LLLLGSKKFLTLCFAQFAITFGSSQLL
jgi:hypothetical protein